MRLIGHLPDEAAARTFSDYLYVQRIDNNVDSQSSQGWGIWVRDEDQLDRATSLLQEFRANPADPRFLAGAKIAGDLRTNEQKAQEAYRQRVRNRRHLFRPLTAYGFGPLTFVLIAVCVGVFLLSSFGKDNRAMMSFFITTYHPSGTGPTWDLSLPEIRHGEVWRLVTPIFLHFNVLHILFNMLWLRDLGSMIEARQGSGILAALVLVLAAGSNLAEVYFGHMADFGGMSGVVYGLLGYVWLRGKFDPASGLFLHQSTMMMMLIWLVACFSGYLGPVANAAHVAGLLLGVAWGYLTSQRHR